MVVTFDPIKDASNVAKHRLSLAQFAEIDLGVALRVDVERDGEARTVVLGPIAGRLHVAVITMRGSTIRVISLRRANRRERIRYEEAYPPER